MGDVMKPLTLEQIHEYIAENVFADDCGVLGVEGIKDAAEAIHAALPPVNPALTVEQIEALLYFVHPDDRKPTAQAIHAALPPDQSARIAELEQQRDALLADAELVRPFLPKPSSFPRIETAMGTAVNALDEAIASIKSGQQAEDKI